MKALDDFALSVIRRIHHVAFAFVFGVGLFILLGWCAGLDRLHTPLPQFGQMAAPTAFAFLLTALSIWLWRVPQGKRRPRAAQVCGAAAGLIAGAQCLQSLSAQSSLNAELLTLGDTPGPPMALSTAISFILIACALCILETETRRRKSPAEWLTLASSFFPFTALIGYIYDQHPLLTPFVPPFDLVKMELHSAIGLLALCIAVFSVRPERGWMARFASSRPEGVVARRLLPTGIAALLMLGWLAEAGEQLGFYEHDDGVAILVALSALTFGLLVRHSMNALATLESRRQNAEMSLHRSEEHLRMALDAARVGTWEWDIRTNEVKWSDSIADLFGLPRGAFDGRYETYLTLIHPDDREALKTRISRSLENIGEPYRTEHRIIWPDATAHWISARGDVVRDENGKPIRLTGTSMDITERKLLERELIEASNREQRRLGQDLHDDLGQWLTGIHLEARALSMKLKPKSESDAAHAEKIVSWAGEALERTRMLARGMAPAVIETGGLAAALQEIATNTERMFRTRCHCTCDETLTIHNTEAALQLYRIAQEAIGNALRHSQASEVLISLAAQEDGRACLLIRDNGRGIPQPLPKTAGMGLRIMQYRAGLLGGHVDIRPAEGGGTEVLCRFSPAV